MSENLFSYGIEAKDRASATMTQILEMQRKLHAESQKASAQSASAAAQANAQFQKLPSTLAQSIGIVEQLRINIDDLKRAINLASDPTTLRHLNHELEQNERALERATSEGKHFGLLGATFADNIRAGRQLTFVSREIGHAMNSLALTFLMLTQNTDDATKSMHAVHSTILGTTVAFQSTQFVLEAFGMTFGSLSLGISAAAAALIGYFTYTKAHSAEIKKMAKEIDNEAKEWTKLGEARLEASRTYLIQHYAELAKKLDLANQKQHDWMLGAAVSRNWYMVLFQSVSAMVGIKGEYIDSIEKEMEETSKWIAIVNSAKEQIVGLTDAEQRLLELRNAYALAKTSDEFEKQREQERQTREEELQKNKELLQKKEFTDQQFKEANILVWQIYNREMYKILVDENVSIIKTWGEKSAAANEEAVKRAKEVLKKSKEDDDPAGTRRLKAQVELLNELKDKEAKYFLEDKLKMIDEWAERSKELLNHNAEEEVRIERIAKEEKDRIREQYARKDEQRESRRAKAEKQKLEEEQKQLHALQQGARQVAMGFADMWAAAISGDAEAARGAWKSLVNIIINAAEAALVASTAMMNAKSVAMFFTNLPSDLAALAAGFAALEVARAMLTSFDKGGVVGMNNSGQERVIRAHDGEMVLTQSDQKALLSIIRSGGGGGGKTLIANFNAPGTSEDMVFRALKKLVRDTNLPIDKIAANTRSKLVLQN